VNSEKYIGLDVHQATIVVAVMDSKMFRRSSFRVQDQLNWAIELSLQPLKTHCWRSNRRVESFPPRAPR
jgi:hypothetical protein